MDLVKVKCAFCGKQFFREMGRYNEAKKFGWRQFCSRECQDLIRLKRVERECANPNCNNKVFRLLNQFKRSKSNAVFCSCSCAATVNNIGKNRKHGLYERLDKICLICGKRFHSARKYCSKKCYYEFLRFKPKVIKILRKQIIAEINDFYKKNGRIPVKEEYRTNYHHYCAARLRFGSWNNAVKAAGFNPNPVLFSEKQIANDGHKCDSFSEKVIDDWLYENKIQHKRSVPYPEDKSLTVDFVTEKNWIEFFGLAGDLKRYDELIKKKFMLSKKHGLPLLAMYPKDLFPVNRLAEIIKV